MAELRRALRSPKIKRVTIEIRIQFGEEPVEIEIPKSTVLAQLGGGNDEAETEAQIFESNPSTVAFI